MGGKMTLTENEINNKLAEMDGWSLDGKLIWKRFECSNFMGAVDFVNRLAAEAERMNHHPEILISKGNRVTLYLTTHDAGQLTEKDFQLAGKIDTAFGAGN